MIKDFDLAFTNKIQAWFSNTIYAHTATVYNVAYNLVDDDPFNGALKYPLISIYRTSGFSLKNNQNFAARKRGLMMDREDVTDDFIMSRFLVMNLPYQIDIYAKNPESLNDITEQLMQALNLDQKILVEQHDVKSGKKYSESYDINYESGPSDISEFTNDDRIFHYSILYNIDNARVVNFRTTPEIKSSEETIDVEGSDPDNL